MWDCEWCERTKADSTVMNQTKTHLFYKRPLSTDSLLEKPEKRSFFGYV